MIAALCVIKNGPYFIEGIDPYDQERDARKYKGPYKVIAHPECSRWGRYWGGGPMLHGTINQKLLGDDECLFAHCLWAVRTFGGIVEQPEASHAFHYYGLPIPNRKGGWTEPDRYGGRSCCVSQGHYGHPAQKLTWLYGININFSELIWGPCKKQLAKLDEGFHSKEERTRAVRTGVCQNMSARQRKLTPEPFRNLLIELVKGT